MSSQNIASSFRDPSGFVFSQDGSIYRQVNPIYQDNYEHLMNSGLYQSLVARKLLVPHEEIKATGAQSDDARKIIKPEGIPFVSYPYEWCFSQLKDAALATLQIQRTALNFGMSLKDCSAYNIQFARGKPILIDTLSFEKYREGTPWVAYRQFCQHFLAPLALMSYRDARLNHLSRVYIDGVPLDLASSLLPTRTYMRPSLLLHVHLHAKSQKRRAREAVYGKVRERKFGVRSFLGLIDSMESCIGKLQWHPKKQHWAGYYDDEQSYAPEAFEHKREIVAEFLDNMKPSVLWDLGANTGLFSHMAGDKGIRTISFDMDPLCVEINYLNLVARNKENVLPLVLDLANPSPKIGWRNEERMSLFERGPADAVLALALIHHLAISNNVPLESIARFFSSLCTSLIIEFIPKSDHKVRELLTTREDIFPEYTKECFERTFRAVFTIKSSVQIRGSERILYWMEKN